MANNLTLSRLSTQKIDGGPNKYPYGSLSTFQRQKQPSSQFANLPKTALLDQKSPMFDQQLNYNNSIANYVGDLTQAQPMAGDVEAIQVVNCFFISSQLQQRLKKLEDDNRMLTTELYNISFQVRQQQQEILDPETLNQRVEHINNEILKEQQKNKEVEMKARKADEELKMKALLEQNVNEEKEDMRFRVKDAEERNRILQEELRVREREKERLRLNNKEQDKSRETMNAMAHLAYDTKQIVAATLQQNQQLSARDRNMEDNNNSYNNNSKSNDHSASDRNKANKDNNNDDDLDISDDDTVVADDEGGSVKGSPTGKRPFIPQLSIPKVTKVAPLNPNIPQFPQMPQIQPIHTQQQATQHLQIPNLVHLQQQYQQEKVGNFSPRSQVQSYHTQYSNYVGNLSPRSNSGSVAPSVASNRTMITIRSSPDAIFGSSSYEHIQNELKLIEKKIKEREMRKQKEKENGGFDGQMDMQLTNRSRKSVNSNDMNNDNDSGKNEKQQLMEEKIIKANKNRKKKKIITIVAVILTSIGIISSLTFMGMHGQDEYYY
ncbi:MAG: hypothetical protein EZS28_023820 [Streblomastix strix]|uniref:Uncharacterized protein n=1 Tax=Streblomastix strix TaxID=222440 RepID=A0A5J4VDT8_9EUKA|nr:MAG: hypothetical protein EZS28_023820 [Streblomastix strix]